MGKRRIILTAIRDVLRGNVRGFRFPDNIENIPALPPRSAVVGGGYVGEFVTKLFDVSQATRDLPRFAIVTEPENIEVSLSGVTGSRSLRLIIQGFLLSRGRDVTRVESGSMLAGEDFVDMIVDRLLCAGARARFEYAFEMLDPPESGCGFSITAIGPIIVEEYALSSNYVYMSVPLLTEFLQTEYRE